MLECQKFILALFFQMQINLISVLYFLTYSLCKHFLANFPICVNFTAIYYLNEIQVPRSCQDGSVI